MISRALALMILAAPLAGAGEAPFLVTAQWEPGSAKRPGAVVLRFSPDAEDLRVNRVPAPRLEWPQGVAAVPASAPGETRPVSAAPGDPQYLADGEAYRLYFATSPTSGVVEGKVVFFYCSKNAGWCKKGVSPVSLALP
ncbi:MAG: hypothetical protein NDJ94_12645 [Vicinamibacteria bacterium]|nr:hypothetical protein [Vicinamibacteria bacterium]